MAYNMTSISGSTNLLEMASGLDTISGGVFAGFTLFTIFAVLLIMLSRRSAPQEAFTASSLVSAIISLLFLAGGFGNVLYPTVFGIMWAIGGVSLYLHNAAR